MTISKDFYRFAQLIVAWFLVLGLFCSCSREPIKVGFIGPLTGPYADLGVQGRNGARLAVEDINKKGGVAGREISLIPCDDESTPQGAVRAYKALADQGVVAVIGPMTSEQSMAVVEVAPSVGIPLVSPTTSTPWLSGKKDLFFRIQPETSRAATALARIVASNPTVNRVCVIADVSNRAHTAPLKEAFVREYERLRGSSVCELAFNSRDESSLQSLLEKIAPYGPDALVILAPARHTGLMLKSLSPLYPSLKFYSCGWAQTEEMIAWAGVYAERIVMVADNRPVDSTDLLRTFSRQYRSRYGIDPSFPAVRAYDAVIFLVEALRECNGRFENLRSVLSRPRIFSGLSGTIILDEYGDAAGDFYIVTVRDGKFKLLDIIEAGDIER